MSKGQNSVATKSYRDIPKLSGKPFTPQEKEDAFNYVLYELSTTDKSIADILDNDNLPNIVTFFKWTFEDADKDNLYKRAQGIRAHMLFTEILKVAKGDGGEDSIVKVQRDRLISDRMVFYAAKALPKVYGDKIDISSNGEAVNILSLGNGVAPPNTTTDTTYIDITE